MLLLPALSLEARAHVQAMSGLLSKSADSTSAHRMPLFALQTQAQLGLDLLWLCYHGRGLGEVGLDGCFGLEEPSLGLWDGFRDGLGCGK